MGYLSLNLFQWITYSGSLIVLSQNYCHSVGYSTSMTVMLRFMYRNIIIQTTFIFVAHYSISYLSQNNSHSASCSVTKAAILRSEYLSIVNVRLFVFGNVLMECISMNFNMALIWYISKPK